MQLKRANLAVLFTHKDRIDRIVPSTDVFFVGGSIRDVLLGKTEHPTDIDCTCAGHPDEIWKEIETHYPKDVSLFRTEKFGTMSLVFNDESDTVITEITPFRTEGTYGDVRHPDQLDRSDSLLEDSNRRDFTINCIYWAGVTLETPITITPQHTSKTFTTACKQFPRHAKLIDGTLIITDHEQIASFTTAGNINTTVVTSLLEKAVVVGSPQGSLNIQQISVLCDPHGGINDLLNGIINTVGTPSERFSEDALRILRGARFVIALNEGLDSTVAQNGGFDFRKKTRDAMKSHANLVKKVSFERINQEVTKIFHGSNPYGYIALLDELGTLGHIFPAVHTCKYNHQPSRHHGFDTYSHTLLTLHALQNMSHADLCMKLAMLYHDTGKPQQYAFIEKAISENPENPDRSGYEHHAEISVRLAQKDLKRLCFSKKIIETVCRYIKRHHRPGELLNGKQENIDKKLRKLLSDGDKQMTMNLIDIAIADRLGQINPIQPPALGGLEMLKERLEQLYTQEGRFTMRDLVIDGNWLMQEYTIAPGPELGTVLKKTFERVLADNTNRNNLGSIKVYIKSLGTLSQQS